MLHFSESPKGLDLSLHRAASNTRGTLPMLPENKRQIKLRLQATEDRADTDKKRVLTNSDLYDCKLEIRVRRPNNGSNKEAY